jgi:hypothetical protein
MTVNSREPIAAADEDGTIQSKTALAMAPPMSFLNLGPNLMQAGEFRDRRGYLSTTDAGEDPANRRCYQAGVVFATRPLLTFRRAAADTRGARGDPSP